MTFIPGTLGVAFYKEGCPLKVIESLNKFSLTQSITSIRHHVDKICELHDQQIVQWKEDLQVRTISFIFPILHPY